MGIYINSTGIAYEQELAAETQKAMVAILSIKWTKYHHMFRNAYRLFFKTCLMPILGYGCESWTVNQLDNLELVRKAVIKKLHSGRYRYHELRHQYLNMQL